MSELVEQLDYRGVEIRIFTDDPWIDPRKDYDHLGTLIWWHRRYHSPDDNPYKGPHEMWCDLAGVISMDESVLFKKAHEKYVVLPVYMYDHSGITISTSPFSCPWDSGQVGYIFCSKERFLAETGYSSRRLFGKVGEAERMLREEVEEYDQYLGGYVYRYEIEIDGETDNCGGLYGLEYALDTAKDAARCLLETL